MTSSAFIENLKQLFAECDTDNNGCLGRHEFRELCTKIGLNVDAADETFDRLDIDKNDRITFDEFAAGFNQYKQQSSTPSPSPSPQPPASNQSPSPPPTARSASSTPPRRSPTITRHNKLSAPGAVSSRARKSASPLGILSLGGSSNTTASGSSSGGGGGMSTDLSGGGGGGGAEYHNSSQDTAGHDATTRNNSMVVYSSDAIGAGGSGSGDYGGNDLGAGSSGQFGSLVSNSSFNQVRNMQDLLDSVQKLQSENQILTQIFFKDKREREEYISQLGEEFDQQVREVEERANRRAREELENEKKRLREMMQAERETLQHHYQTIEKMSKMIKSPNNKLFDADGVESIDKVKSKLEDTYLENRQLKRSLLDTKTDVAMIWKEMEKLKRQYEDKLSSAYERNNETRSECDHIKQQLSLMKDSNRKLQDASDVITTYITDKVEPVIKGAANGGDDDPAFLGAGTSGLYFGGGGSRSLSQQDLNNSRRGSLLSEYLNNGDESNSMDAGNASMGDVESLGSGQGRYFGGHKRDDGERLTGKNIPQINEPFTQPNHNDAQSTSERNPPPPASTLKKSTSYQQANNINQTHQGNKLRDSSATSNSISEGLAESANSKSSLRQQDTEHNSKLEVLLQGKSSSVETASSTASSTKSSIRSIGRHFFIGSRAQSSDAQNTIIKETKPEAAKLAATVTKSASVDQLSQEPEVEPADGPSKATFDIILVGDSFVGKSSFAARFMEGSFVQGLISNCSIDFKTKSYKVDGINYTVNLWDTAGQERFRSITASYFRKADGIILMYDVTEKRSYLNVRNWMSTIADTAAENVAVLLIGNKIDLRNKSNIDKCIPTDEGFRLAKEYEIVFLETSVKTGTNLIPSMGKLIKLIAKNKTPAEEDTDRIRLNDKSKTFNCMPKNC